MNRVYDYYRSFVSVKENKYVNFGISVYPNPAISSVSVFTTIDIIVNEISILDITSQIVLLEKINQTN